MVNKGDYYDRQLAKTR